MELRRVDRDLTALTVLALLITGPRHAYEMHRFILDTHKDFVTGLPRSMYHAVDRLLRAELISVVGTDRAGTRPERTVYAITDAGRTELAGRVRRLLEHPEPDATLFAAALSFVGCIPVRRRRRRSRSATTSSRPDTFDPPRKDHPCPHPCRLSAQGHHGGTRRVQRVFNVARRGAWAVPLANRFFAGFREQLQGRTDDLARRIEAHLGSP